MNCPLSLNTKLMEQVLRILSYNGYELIHKPGSPVLKVGHRMIVAME